MTAKNNKKTSVEQKRSQDEKKETTRNWLARRLRTPASRQGNNNEDTVEMKRQISLRRPQTAPSASARKPTVFPTTLEPPSARPINRPPPRPPRPDSGVIRDVNAWLDASMIKPAPTLMAGLPYWREGSFTGSGISADVRYAVPIVRDSERQSTSHIQQVKSFCRRAKRMQVRMPTLLRTRSQRVSVVQQKKLNRRSTSMPLLSISDEVHAVSTPNLILRSRSLLNTTPRLTITTTSAHEEVRLRMGPPQVFEEPRRLGSPVTVRFDEQESHMERRVNTAFGQSTRVGDWTRSSTANHSITREDSMGNLSDAPTYFTGPPPPSYRSRAASIVTTSSFGCIDGMSSERRQLSQHRATQRSRGMRGKFKKLAQKAHFTK